MRIFAPALILLLSAPITAQQKTSGATLSGTVFCEDTGRPARFARVFITAVEPSHAGEDFLQQMQKLGQQSAKKNGKLYTPPSEEQKKQQAQAARQLDAVASMLNATNAGMDGTYRATDLKPGTYYVHALVPGYVDPYAQFSPEDFQSSDPEVRSRIAALPTVRIGSDAESQTLNLRLQRGGALNGRVVYDDGSPAVGWNVWALRVGTNFEVNAALSPSLQRQAAEEMGQPVSVTDDRGNYRITGLTDGQYTLRVDMGALGSGTVARNATRSGSGIRIAVYSGNVLHPSEAKVLRVRQGEEESMADMVVPMKSLHTLSGKVTANSDGHALNKGTVTLSTKADPQIHGRAMVQSDGSFVFEALPGNTTYTLTLNDAGDATYKESKAAFLGVSIPDVDVQKSYAHAEQDVMLGDADNTGVHFGLNAVETPAADEPKATPPPSAEPGR